MYQGNSYPNFADTPSYSAPRYGIQQPTKSSNGSIDIAALQKMGAGAWLVLATVVLGAYHLFSDGDFSFLMTLSSMVSTFGMLCLCWQFFTSQSLEGISLKSMQLHTVAFLFRFLSTLWHEGYLPLDSSGDYVYRGAELISLLACAVSLGLAYSKINHTYDSEKDSFGSFGPTGADRAKYGGVWIAAPALLVALVAHPTLNGVMWSDVAWTFALYLDVLAVAPQLWMFHKSGGKVAKYTAHYVFSLGFGRLLMLLFWAFSYHELTGIAGIFVMLSQVVGAVLMGDFFYYYAKSQHTGQELVLPSAVDMV